MKTQLLLLPLMVFNILNAQQEGKNIIKTNVTAYAFRNLNLNYERSINKTFSVSLGFSTITNGDVPIVKKYFEDQVDNEFKDIKMSMTSLTIEPRIYLGKNYNSGFYFAPYYRYTKLKMGDMVYNFSYTDSNNVNREIPFNMSGDISANSFGLMLGAQWYFGTKKNWVLDWWIVGGHYGFSSGNVVGRPKSGMPLSPEDQEYILEEVNGFDIPIIKYDVDADSKEVRVKIDGPWAGLRSGLSVGYRF